MRPNTRESLPYVGPRPFERVEEDQKRFFGRDRETEEIVSLIFGHPLVLVYAQSGAGKTSLFNARIAPTLENRGFDVLPFTRVQGAIPKGLAQEEITNLYVFNALLPLAPEADFQDLVGTSLAAFLAARPRPTGAGGRAAPRVLVLDQFEELFTLYPKDWHNQREDFFRQVAEALDADPLLRIILIIREDYMAQLDPFASPLPEALRTRFRVERLGREAALAAVKGPLQETPRSFAEGVAERLVDELLKVRVQTATGETAQLSGEFVEPVQLQVVCQSLWRGLPRDAEIITEDHLQAAGDVDQALAEFYQGAVGRAAQKSRAGTRRLRRWFEQSLITPAGTRGTVYRGPQRSGGMPNTAVDVLEDLHLIRGEWRAGARWYELTHDRFIGPIQASNAAWRQRRRRNVGVVLGAAGAGLLLIPAVSLLIWFGTRTTAPQPSKELQATATAEAAIRAHIDEGFVLAQQGQYDEAIVHYNEAIAQAGGDNAARAYVYRGIAYLNLGDQEQALQDYDTAIEQDPGYALAYANKGNALRQMGRYDEALEALNQAIDLDPDYVYAYNLRGVVYAELDEQERAIEDFDAAIRINADYRWAPMNKGNALRELGRYDEALAVLEDTLSLFPDYAEAHYARGRVYADLGEYERAVENYDEAIRLAPDHARAHAFRGRALRLLGRHEEALEAMNQAIAFDPHDVDAYYVRGRVYADLGDYERAIEDYDAALDLNAEYKWAYTGRGHALRELGRYDEALEALNRAIRLDPAFASAYVERGRVYLDMGDEEGALPAFDRAIALDPDNPWSYYYRGLTYERLGDIDAAVADLENALQFDEQELDEEARSAATTTLERLREQ